MQVVLHPVFKRVPLGLVGVMVAVGKHSLSFSAGSLEL